MMMKMRETAKRAEITMRPTIFLFITVVAFLNEIIGLSFLSP